MAIDAYLYFSGKPGPSTTTPDTVAGSSSAPGGQNAGRPATVQVGESTMGQVAGRMGLDQAQLQAANPHIKDPENLKAGQEIYLPANHGEHSEREQGEVESHHHHHHEGNELPNAPLGSSIEASVMKSKLDALGNKGSDD